MATTDKYDRQLRLWGSNGQRKLMNSNILLIKADNVGTEAMKNLVLPGIGSFTILDDFIVDQSDLGCNFFTTASACGRPRAEVVTELLCELNPDVKGYARVSNFQNILQNDVSFFHSFDLILTSNLLESQLLPLADYCWNEDIPVIALKSIGFIGSLRIQVKDHSIIELKNDQDPFDLRIANPFPGLKDYCLSVDLGRMDSLEHKHVPYVVILFQAIESWKAQHEGKLPSNFAEKEAFKQSVKQAARDYSQEINFHEAVDEAYRAFNVKQVSQDTQQLLASWDKDTQSNKLRNSISHEAHQSLKATEKLHFNILVEAMRIYCQQFENSVPLSGNLPDMTSTTDQYMQLQQIYSQQAHRDQFQFNIILQTILQSHGVPANTIGEEEIEVFL